ncbi:MULTISPECIES: IclR family transcriptional regulator [Roseobacteraceae]|jgi:DNA-binding IclR family transcriptional regulator|uniref:HTH-type transcriptional regulator TsaQ1/TsaQ2 n=1 Tax=Pseudosulfitobacter pseudonitzschiae TaxID=1402135 RepID=A0A221K026_9RHOB|nr:MULTISPECIES: IclR family transcriptional regulator [Roseobacteraceae]ASM72331.1 HTH-type transcriptional regulator TsaQ1/TsaQ2 [Pseudosulfitobacter pseudonitzschiae]
MNDPDLAMDTAEDKDRNFITALARGLDILRCFKEGEGALTNQDFAARTGLPKPTVSRLTHTLCVLEYLVADPRTGTYRLGAGVLRLGFSVLSSMGMVERARDTMRALSNGPNSYITVALAEAYKTDAVYVAVEKSMENVSLTMQVGARLPIFHSAIGRAMLVGMDDDDRAMMFERANVKDPDGHATRKATFDQALAEYENLGYCRSYGDWRPDVNGIAAPVFALSGRGVYGLNVGGPSFHVKKKHLESAYGKLLVDAATRLSTGS